MCAKDDYIEKLEKENAELKKRLEQLERIVNQNSKNSSRPPSSDFGRNAKTTKPKKKTKRTRTKGAQKGHKPCLRQLLPPESVTKSVDLIPDRCTCGCSDLGECDESPLRFQTIDIPPIKPKVTEYVQHMLECKQCGEVVYQILPDSIDVCFREYIGSGG